MTFAFRAPVPLLHVFDLEASLRFYRDALNFEVLSTQGSDEVEDDEAIWAMLRSGDLTLMLQGARRAAGTLQVPDAARMFWHADTVLYLLCSELSALCAHLRGKGITVSKGSPVFPHMDQVFVSDPDGYMLCFHRPAEEGVFA